MEIIILFITLLTTGALSFFAKKTRTAGLITFWGQVLAAFFALLLCFKITGWSCFPVRFLLCGRVKRFLSLFDLNIFRILRLLLQMVL